MKFNWRFKNRLLSLESEMVDNTEDYTKRFKNKDTNYIADPSDPAQTIEKNTALELRT